MSDQSSRYEKPGKIKWKMAVYAGAGVGLIGVGVFMVCRYFTRSEIQALLLGVASMVFSALLFYEAWRHALENRRTRAYENEK